MLSPYLLSAMLVVQTPLEDACSNLLENILNVMAVTYPVYLKCKERDGASCQVLEIVRDELTGPFQNLIRCDNAGALNPTDEQKLKLKTLNDYYEQVR